MFSCLTPMCLINPVTSDPWHQWIEIKWRRRDISIQHSIAIMKIPTFWMFLPMESVPVEVAWWWKQDIKSKAHLTFMSNKMAHSNFMYIAEVIKSQVQYKLWSIYICICSLHLFLDYKINSRAWRNRNEAQMKTYMHNK